MSDWGPPHPWILCAHSSPGLHLGPSARTQLWLWFSCQQSLLDELSVLLSLGDAWMLFGLLLSSATEMTDCNWNKVSLWKQRHWKWQAGHMLFLHLGAIPLLTGTHCLFNGLCWQQQLLLPKCHLACLSVCLSVAIPVCLCLFLSVCLSVSPQGEVGGRRTNTNTNQHLVRRNLHLDH